MACFRLTRFRALSLPIPSGSAQYTAQHMAPAAAAMHTVVHRVDARLALACIGLHCKPVSPCWHTLLSFQAFKEAFGSPPSPPIWKSACSAGMTLGRSGRSAHAAKAIRACGGQARLGTNSKGSWLACDQSTIKSPRSGTMHSRPRETSILTSSSIFCTMECLTEAENCHRCFEASRLLGSMVCQR